jgi:myo-inositol-1(or 4)-monophosphatase
MVLNKMDWDNIKKVAFLASQEGGKVLKDFLGKKLKVKHKGEIDIVTEADYLSEHAITKIIKEKFPDHQIYAEEKKDYTDIPSSFIWFIDPLDGTTNFAHGLPIFCISIALEVEGELMMGLVYDPPREELFFALKGKRAYLNNKRIKVSETKKLDKSLLVTGFPYDVRTSKENNLNYFQSFIMKAQAVRRLGSAALDLCYVASGRFDGFWEMKLSPWDVAAGSLIVKEAGGEVTNFSGKKFNIHGREILADNGLIHKKMIEVLVNTKNK